MKTRTHRKPTTTHTVWLDQSDWDWLDSIAARDGITRSEALTWAVRTHPLMQGRPSAKP